MYKEEVVANANQTFWAVIQQRNPSDKVLLRVWKATGANDGDEVMIFIGDFDEWREAALTAHTLTGVTPPDQLPG